MCLNVFSALFLSVPVIPDFSIFSLNSLYSLSSLIYNRRFLCFFPSFLSDSLNCSWIILSPRIDIMIPIIAA